MGGTAYSLGIHSFSHIRSAGSRGRKGSPCEGGVFGGVYYPRFRKQNGVIVPARWEGSFYKNNMYWSDPQTGERREGRKDIIRICAWNGNNAQKGRGLADLFAKAISPGKELSGVFEMRTYDRKVYLQNGHQVMESDGSPLIIPGMIKFYVERGQFVLGADSAKFVQAEIDDGIRPSDWMNAASPNHQRWQQANRERMNEVWEGLPYYGYAQVITQNNVQYEYPLRNEPVPRLRIFTPTNYERNTGNGGFGGNDGNRPFNNNANAGGFNGNSRNGGFNPVGRNNSGFQNTGFRNDNGGNQNNGFQNNSGFNNGNTNGQNWSDNGNGFGGGNQNNNFNNSGGGFGGNNGFQNDGYAAAGNDNW